MLDGCPLCMPSIMSGSSFAFRTYQQDLFINKPPGSTEHRSKCYTALQVAKNNLAQLLIQDNKTRTLSRWTIVRTIYQQKRLAVRGTSDVVVPNQSKFIEKIIEAGEYLDHNKHISEEKNYGHDSAASDNIHNLSLSIFLTLERNVSELTNLFFPER